MGEGRSVAVATHAVTRRFGDIEAVKGIDAELNTGQITALVGANGSGKTTLLRLLAGILPPSEGVVEMLGIKNPTAASRSEAQELRRLSTYISQDPALDPEMTGLETLNLMAALHGIEKQQRRHRLRDVAESLGLQELLDRRIETLSGGQRRRLHIAAGLIHDPKLLLLDEPEAGLDLQGRDVLWADLARRAAENRAIVITTHDLEAVEHHAHRVLILDHGAIVHTGKPADLESEIRDVIRQVKKGGIRRGRGPGSGRGRR